MPKKSRESRTESSTAPPANTRRNVGLLDSPERIQPCPA